MLLSRSISFLIYTESCREFIRANVTDDKYPPEWPPILAVLTEDFTPSTTEELVKILSSSKTYDQLSGTYSKEGIAKVEVKEKLKLRLVDGLHRVVAASGSQLKHFRVKVFKYLPPEAEEVGERVGHRMWFTE